MTMRFKLPDGGDIPPAAAARRLGLTLEALNETLPDLVARGFPAPDPTTGNFDLDAINRWQVWEEGTVYGRLRAAGFTCLPDVRGHGYVYFIEGGELIKIGRAIDPFRRAADLQIASPTRLILRCVVPGHSELEKTLHAMFADDRRHGEWFAASNRLILFMGQVRKDGYAALPYFGKSGEIVIDG